MRRNVIDLRADRWCTNLQPSAVQVPIHRQRIELRAPHRLLERNRPRCVHRPRRHCGLPKNLAHLLAVENNVVVPLHFGIVVVVQHPGHRHHRLANRKLRLRQLECCGRRIKLHLQVVRHRMQRAVYQLPIGIRQPA